MNSFKLLSVKIYNIKEQLGFVFSFIEAENIYNKKGRSKKHFEKHQRSKHTSIVINKYQSFPFHRDEVIHLYKGIRSCTQWMLQEQHMKAKMKQIHFWLCIFFALNACSTETNERVLHANAPIGSNISAPTAEVWMVRYVHRFISSKLIQKRVNFFTVNMGNTNLHNICRFYQQNVFETT